MVFFTDAVNAIAITLLVLPLTDALGTAANEHPDEGFFQVISTDPYWSMFLGVVISFFVIARLWSAHHQLYERVESYTRLLMTLNLVWVFTIVMLPLTTSFVAIQRFNVGTYGAYLGDMTASSLVLTLMALTIHLTPGLAGNRGPATRHRFIGSAVTTLGFVLALVIGVLAPAINYKSLFIIVLTGPAEALVERALARRDARRAATR